KRQVLLDLIERMCLSAPEPKTLALLRLVIAEAVRFPELAKSLYAENSYVLAPVVEYLAEAHSGGTLYVPSPDRPGVHLSPLPFGGVRFFIPKPLAGPEERRAWAEGVVGLVLRGWMPAAAAITARNGPDEASD